MDLNEEEDTRMDSIREDHCKWVTEEGVDKKKIHTLRWKIYSKYKHDLIKI